jgi:hypothetical protein
VTDSLQQENFIASMALAAEFADDSQRDINCNRITKSYFSLSTQFHRCIRFFCERSRTKEEKSSLLLKIFRRESDALVLLVSLLSAEHASRDRNAAVSQLLLDRDYEELNALCLGRIEDRQGQGKLINHIDERDIRLMWTTIGDAKKIRELLLNDFLSYPAVMHAILPFVGYSSSSEGTFYTIFLDQLEKYTDPAKVLLLLQDQPNLSNSEAGIRDCLAFSIEAKQNNQPYDHDAQLKSVYKYEN